MFLTAVRIVLGYVIASAAAAAALILSLPIVAGVEISGLLDYLAATVVIGVFAWAGFLFAIRAHFMGWTQASTFAVGGLVAMVVGVASISAIGFGQGLIHGYMKLDTASALSAARNIAQLLWLGVLPGLTAGLTYWLVAVPKAKIKAV